MQAGIIVSVLFYIDIFYFFFYFESILKGITYTLIAFTAFIIFFMVQGATIFVLLISNANRYVDCYIGFNIWHIGLFLVFRTFL